MIECAPLTRATWLIKEGGESGEDALMESVPDLL